MSTRFLFQLGLLTAAVLLVIFWTANSSLSGYTTQLTAALIVLYFADHTFFGKRLFTLSVDGFILTVITLLLITQTGGLSSPLFFLIYILLFGLALLLDPLLILIFTLILAIFFFGQVHNLPTLIEIIGLVLIAPIALFFGKQYLKALEEAEKIKILTKKEEKLEEEILHEEETLRGISSTLKNNVSQILDITSQMVPDLSRLTLAQRENLQKIHQNAKDLLKLGDKLEEKIDKE